MIAVHPSFDIVVARSTIQSDKDPNIRTGQIGGTLAIESESLDDVVLLHNGAELNARGLVYLANRFEKTNPLVIPRLQPGHYVACSKEKKCNEGDLAPNATLTLRVPQ